MHSPTVRRVLVFKRGMEAASRAENHQSALLHAVTQPPASPTKTHALPVETTEYVDWQWTVAALGSKAPQVLFRSTAAQGRIDPGRFCKRMTTCRRQVFQCLCETREILETHTAHSDMGPMLFDAMLQLVAIDESMPTAVQDPAVSLL